MWASKMAQQVKVPAAKPDDPEFSPWDLRGTSREPNPGNCPLRKNNLKKRNS